MITYRDLLQFGLSEKEARVYLASLELGPATATQIAQKAEVNRATTYVELEALMKTGLMSTFEKGKTTLFSAESPAILKRILEKQEHNAKLGVLSLETLLPELLKIHEYAEERPRVRFFEGKEGLLTMRDDFLRTKDKSIESITNIDSFDTVFTEEENRPYREARLKKKIAVRVLYTRNEGPLSASAPLVTMRFIPLSEFPVSSDITIYDHNVAIASLQNKLVGVIIENQDIANTLRAVFNLAWQGAERYK